eukprot:14261975-Ditylum_brightwellii.AAC.1
MNAKVYFKQLKKQSIDELTTLTTTMTITTIAQQQQHSPRHVVDLALRIPQHFPQSQYNNAKILCCVSWTTWMSKCHLFMTPFFGQRPRRGVIGNLLMRLGTNGPCRRMPI